MALNIDIEKRDPQGLDRMEKRERPFSRVNYYMMGGCLALIVLGFVLTVLMVYHYDKRRQHS